ncbi:MAG: hypothetical protein EBS51_13140 [Planctomycetia bacterium]|nr:hypothetical protein [Planctomycetia bacterium]
MHSRSLVIGVVLASWLPCATRLRADDWPQWMGPRRDGVWREADVVEAIPAGGLPLRWRITVKAGYAGPAVANGRVYLMDYDRREGTLANDPGGRSTLAGNERVLCIDAATGEIVWKHEYDCPYSISYAAGPRCTPTVADGRVYTLGAEGHLTCLDATTGAVTWKKDLRADYGAPTPIWGFCGHPLVEGDLLVCLVGGPGSVAVAFDRHSGREVWRAISASESGYCPPTMIESGGQRQLASGMRTSSMHSTWPPAACSGRSRSSRRTACRSWHRRWPTRASVASSSRAASARSARSTDSPSAARARRFCGAGSPRRRCTAPTARRTWPVTRSTGATARRGT